MRKDPLPQGADLCGEGVRFRVWAPHHRQVEAVVTNASDERRVPLELDAAGYHSAIDGEARAGDRYKYRLDGGSVYPDPASRWQPDGVHGPSAVIDPTEYVWHDADWRAPVPRDLVIYELHVGTFTREGTFLAAIDRLEFLRKLGVTAIELMPVADFPGERNWGYDGVCLYAPARVYGHPDDLRGLVNAAHAAGIAVILDVVYNHFGPDGNYLGAFSPHYFNERKKTPWGAANNFDGEHSGPVRAFFTANPLYWMDEFHIDGFRFDATHAIDDSSPRHILEEMTAAIHGRGGFAIAEDARNEARFVEPPSHGGYGFDGIWADDFHHVTRVGQTGENEGYFGDYSGTPMELVDVLQHGWLYRGQLSRTRHVKRGTECRHVAPEKFIHCISNHDQVGNHAFGERLNQSIAPEAYRAASALLCLTPYTPLLFMGQEWAASTPFCFFTDHNPELGKLVTEGRRREFKNFSAFRDPETREKIPDPQAESTWKGSVLNWEEIGQDAHAKMSELYRVFLELRAGEAAFRPRDRESWQAAELDLGIGGILFRDPEIRWLILFDLRGGHEGFLRDEWLCRLPPGRRWHRVLSSNESRFGGAGPGKFSPVSSHVGFAKPETVLLRSARSE